MYNMYTLHIIIICRTYDGNNQVTALKLLRQKHEMGESRVAKVVWKMCINGIMIRGRYCKTWDSSKRMTMDRKTRKNFISFTSMVEEIVDK